jgi:hypothetical protein
VSGLAAVLVLALAAAGVPGPDPVCDATLTTRECRLYRAWSLARLERDLCVVDLRAAGRQLEVRTASAAALFPAPPPAPAPRSPILEIVAAASAGVLAGLVLGLILR